MCARTDDDCIAVGIPAKKREQLNAGKSGGSAGLDDADHYDDYDIDDDYDFM